MTPDDPDTPGSYASPPCYAHELEPAPAEGPPDPQDAAAVARWRRAERARLLAGRRDLSVAEREAAATAIGGHLDRLLGDLGGLTVSGWWPIKGELDLRPWLAGLSARGARAALPLVIERAAPLVFRPWCPRSRMERGFWNIPVPADGPEVVPDITLAPLVGFDEAGYRLGYGGGYFDRTLASLAPRVRAIGIGFASARLATIHPQWHDIPMEAVVTEQGIAMIPRGLVPAPIPGSADL